MSLPFDSALDGAEYDEAILKVRSTILVGMHKAADAQVNGPSFAFTNEANSGLYRAAAGDIRLSVLGHDKTKWSVNNVEHFKPVLFPDGGITGPGIAFANGTNSGIYRAGAGDIRFGVLGVDVLAMKFITASGATSAPSLGIGMVPLRGGLNILCPNNLLSGSGIQLNNTDPTDGNATGISMRCTTTGAGGTAFTEMTKLSTTFVTHNDATRSSTFEFLWTDSSAARLIRFTGNNIITSDVGAITLATGTANGDINLLPNGTGKIVLGLANPLRITTGTNARAGNAVLVGGTITVANTSVTANTQVIATRKTAGGTLGFLTFTVSAGVSFTITSSSGTDTSTVSYFLIEVS